MVLESIILIGGVILTAVVFWTLGSIITDQLRPLAPIVFLQMPLIGDVNCDAPPITDPPPAFVFGEPGYNEPGCLHAFFRTAALVGIGIVLSAGMLMILWKNMWNHESAVKQMISFSVVAGLLVFLIPVWAPLYDGLADIMNNFNLFIAAIPHNPDADTTDEEFRQMAEKSVTFEFYNMRDATAGRHECIHSEDVDGDGRVDSSEVDMACFAIYGLTSDILHVIMVFVLGGFVSIATQITAYIAGTLRYFFIGIAAVLLPFVLVLSRVPYIGEYADLWIKAFIGLAASGLFIAAISAIGPGMILGITSDLYERGISEPDAVRNMIFIMDVGLAFSKVSVILLSARFLGAAILSASGIVVGGLMTAFGAGLRAIGQGGGAAMAGAGFSDAGRMFSTGVGSGGYFYNAGYGSLDAGAYSQHGQSDEHYSADDFTGFYGGDNTGDAGGGNDDGGGAPIR